MKNGVKPIPPGMHTLTPHLIIRDAAKAIDFYKKAFGAVETMRMPTPDGKIGHAELTIGDSTIFLADECPEMGARSPQALGGTAVTLSLYVEDADAVCKQAVAAGASVRMPVTNMFWGDRYGKVADPFGHEWAIATHIEDVAPDEIARRAEAAFAQMGKK